MADTALVRFGSFELDLESGDLRKSGRRIPLQEQPFKVLVALLKRAGHLVTRDELSGELWAPGTFVDAEHGLNTTVRRLRDTLGDVADTPRFIETLPRRGYRFIAPLAAESSLTPKPSRRSVAVLPFVNLSSESDGDDFADGMTEDVIAQLSKVHALKVISRTSVMTFRTGERDVRQIASALGVAAVLEGSIRRAGHRVRIVAQLIDAESADHIWSDTYDRDVTDVFAIQSDVALQIAAALDATLSPVERARFARPATTNLDAYRSYLHGRRCLFRFTDQGVREAITCFEAAIEKDPAYALAHVGVGFAYLVLGVGHGNGALPSRDAYRRSRQSIERALAINASLGDAHGVLAGLKFMADYDWAGAERSFEEAADLNPGCAETYDVWGLMLAAIGRYDEALAVQRHAQELDPLAPVWISDFATTLLRAGRAEEALQQAERAMRIEPDYPMGHSTRAWACLQMGRNDEGIAGLEQAVSLSPGNTLFLGQLGQAYAMVGRAADARQILGRMQALSRGRYISPYHLSYVLTGLGDHDGALDLLERAVDERSAGVYGVAGSFLFTPLRSHPRFAALLRRMSVDARVVSGARAPTVHLCVTDGCT